MKKTLSIFLALSIIFSGSYIFFEPRLMSAAYDEFTVSQSVTGEISLSNCGNINMSPAIAGLTGGVGTGTTTCAVTTSDTAGYTMSLSASTSPALKASTYTFADYTVAAGNVPDYTWSIGASASEFGYTVEGSQTIVQAKFLDNGSACNTGTGQNAYKCWLNASTTNATIGYYANEITTSTTTTIGFKAEVTSGRNQEEGSYTATIGITAVTN